MSTTKPPIQGDTRPVTSVPQVGWSGPWTVTVHELFDYGETATDEDSMLSYVVVVGSYRAASGLELRHLSFRSSFELPADPAQGGVVIQGWYRHIDPEWVTRFGAENVDDKAINPRQLWAVFSARALKELLPEHLQALYSKGPMRELEAGSDKSEVATAARLYTEFTAWGSTDCAYIIERLMGIERSEAYNLLRSARRAGFLPRPGSGARGRTTKAAVRAMVHR